MQTGNREIMRKTKKEELEKEFTSKTNIHLWKDIREGGTQKLKQKRKKKKWKLYRKISIPLSIYSLPICLIITNMNDSQSTAAEVGAGAEDECK